MDSHILSGTYSGTFRATRHGEVITLADVSISFDDSKYHVDLRYERDALGRKRRVIVCDGTVMGTSRFSPGISVTGAEGELIPARPSRSGLVRAQMAGFPWDPAKLHREVVIVERLIENVGDALDAELDANGDILVHYKSGNSPVTVQFPKRFGYRVGAKEVLSSNNSVAHRFKVVWREWQGEWFVSKFLEEWPARGELWELEVVNASVGTSPDPELFALSAMELPGGARIIDRTSRSSDPKSKLHFVPVSDERIEEATDAALSEVAKLPNSRSGHPQHREFPQVRNTNLWIWVLAVNLICVAVLVVIGWYRRC